MGTAKAGHITTMTMTAAGSSSTRTDVAVRGMTVTIDEPPARGGTDAGATPPETVLAALLGCTNRISHKIAGANGFDIQHMSIELSAAFDRRGVNLETEVDVPLADVELRIAVTTDGGEGALEILKRDLKKYCPVSKILRQAGTNLTEIWTLREA
jgi:uncharacterized OsmC-like protein